MVFSMIPENQSNQSYWYCISIIFHKHQTINNYDLSIKSVLTRYNSFSIRGINRRVTSESRDNQAKIEQETNRTKIKIFLLQIIYKETGIIRFYWGHRSMIRSRSTKNPSTIHQHQQTPQTPVPVPRTLQTQ